MSNGAASVTFTADLTDGQNITQAYVWLQNEAGSESESANLSLISGTAQNGVWQGTITIPQGAAAGSWYYQGQVDDGVNDLNFVNEPGLSQNLPAGAPGPVTVTDSSPTASPQVVSLSISPSSVDVSNGAASVTFTADLTDGQNITQAYVWLQNEAGSESESANLSLISGTAQNGVWQGTITIPQGAAAGSWYYQGQVDDGVNDLNFVNEPGLSQNLPAGAPGPVTVTDSSPTASPQVVSLSISPSSVDVSNGAASVTFTADLTDGQNITQAYVWLQNEAGSESESANLSLISGTAQNGVWQGTITIPQGAAAGSWYYQGQVDDGVNDLNFVNEPGLSQNLPAGAPGPVTVTDTPTPPPPATSGGPGISGTAQQGQTLTDSHAPWSNNPTSYSYQWEDCDSSGNNCSAISGATGQTYTLTGSDVGDTIRVQETATNAGGTGGPAISPATAVVVPLAPATSGGPGISGTAQQGQTLTDSHAPWSNNPTSYSYQWEDCDSSGNNCSAISGATGQTYTLTGSDVGDTIRVQETATNAGGTGGPAISPATAVVVPLAPAGPEVQSVSFSPSSVDVSSGAQQVTVSMDLTDGRNISNVNMNFSGPSGSEYESAGLTLVSGSAQDGTWQGTVTIPQGAAAGSWYYSGTIGDGLNSLIFSKYSGGSQNLPSNAPGPLGVTDSNSIAGPEVQSVSFSPSSVDVSSGAQQVTVSMDLTDGRNISNVNMNFSGPSGSEYESAGLTLVSGSAQDGTWQGTVTIPQGAAAGSWYYSGTIGDGLNSLIFSKYSGGSQNLPSNAPGPLGVTDSNSIAGPEVQSVSFSPSSVDVSSGAQQVTVSMDLTDGRNISNVNMNFSGPSGSEYESAGLTLVSGSAQDGTWQGTVTIPQGAAAGSWYYSGTIGDGLNSLIFSKYSGGSQNLPSNAPGPLGVTDSNSTVPPPENSAAPEIAGVAQQGQTLTETHGSWSNSPTGYSYQWEDCDTSGNNCSAISGATGQTYTLIGSDVGDTIRVQETASNAGGTSAPATSSASQAVRPLPPTSSGGPSISGSAQQGQTLTEAHGSWSNSPTSYSYQWEDCDSSGNNCSAISGATRQTYTLTGSDVGQTIRVQETASNAGGSGAPASSAATGVVQPVPSGPSGGSSGGSSGSGGNGGSVGSTGGPVGSTGGSGATSGGPGTPTLGSPHVAGTAASVPVSCAGSPGASCSVTVTLSVTETLKGNKVIALAATAAKRQKSRTKTVVLGTANVKLTSGQSISVRVSLNSVGRQMLATHHTVGVKLTITDNGHTIAGHTVTFKATATKKREA